VSSVVSTASATSADELALFHRTLAEMCRAELPLPKAFRLLQGDLRRAGLRAAVAAMANDVEQGTPLAEAYAARKQEFPPLYAALIEIGLATGDLPGVLEEISAHAARRAAVADRMRKALAYPLVAAVFVLFCGAGLLLFVRPTLWTVPDQLGIDPGTTPFWALGALGALFLATVLFGWLRGPIDGASSRFCWPGIGRLRRYAAKTQLLSTLALLLRREVPLSKALDLAARADPSAASMALEAKDGSSLREVLSGFLEPSLLWLVEAADGGPDTPRALADVADIYANRLDRSVDRLTTLVVPVAELVIGAVVLVFAFSFMIPLFEWASEIFRL